MSKKENNSGEKLPEGIIYEMPQNWSGQHLSLDTIKPFQAGAQNIPRTFDYTEKHQVIDGVGVRFSVENLPPPKKDHLKKKNISSRSVHDDIKKSAAEFYSSEFSDKTKQSQGNKDLYTARDIRVEKISAIDKHLVHQGGRSFFDCCVCAFAQHLPLALSPDHFWTLITYAFAKHVDQNSKVLSKKFVKHDGKKVIRIKADNIKPSEKDKPNTGSTPKDWEDTIFPKFSSKIKSFIGDKIHSTIIGDFSTTTPAAKGATEITLMSSMKNYFRYEMSAPGCGIPEFTLLGTEKDWINLRQKAEELGKLMTKRFAKYWLPLLLPVLDKFVEAYQGKVHYGFWQTMVKLRSPGRMSGASPFVSGWIQILYPYLTLGELNKDLRPWKHMYFKGPTPSSFPSVASAAPVTWMYRELTFQIRFHAGFIGFSQSRDGTLSPSIGWWITHDPEPPQEKKIELIQDEIDSLFLGHKEEHKKGAYKVRKNWVDSIERLIVQEKHCLEGLSRTSKAKALARKKKRPKLRKV